ncbi:MAG: hypothetical protein K0Q76_3158 [Panacagrimonas sp.]|jgi:uncharacterized protein YggE|nr:SIMPL domain-containing protein [Panacagrimonas sp.]MCC2658050.1 hypothetical protein [Panacagrimonas sp.]
MKTLAIRPLLLSAALLAGVAPGAYADEPSHRHVAVSGQGEATAMPDRARVRMGVTKVSPDLAAAETQVNTIVRAFLTEARALGLRDEHINTTGTSIQPEYVWDEKERNNRLVGYRVSRDIEALVLDLGRLGDVVLRATKVGVNQVQPPQLESSKEREVQQQALVKATEDAQARARVIASTLGMKVGMVHTVNASESGPPPPMPKMAMMRMAADGAGGGNEQMGLNAGQLRYSASVNAEFELLPP